MPRTHKQHILDRAWTHYLAPRLLLLAALLASLTILPSAPALTAGIVVTTDADSGGPGCSLRDAITTANTNTTSGGCTAGSKTNTNTIIFASNYTITLASTLPTLTSTLTIDGTGHNSTISGNNAVQVVLIGSSGVAILTNMSIRNDRNSASDSLGEMRTSIVLSSPLEGERSSWSK